jgi:hypothetical protein
MYLLTFSVSCGMYGGNSSQAHDCEAATSTAVQEDDALEVSLYN